MGCTCFWIRKPWKFVNSLSVIIDGLILMKNISWSNKFHQFMKENDMSHVILGIIILIKRITSSNMFIQFIKENMQSPVIFALQILTKLNQHVLSVHEGKQYVICDICSANFEKIIHVFSITIHKWIKHRPDTYQKIAFSMLISNITFIL